MAYLHPLLHFTPFIGLLPVRSGTPSELLISISGFRPMGLGPLLVAVLLSWCVRVLYHPGLCSSQVLVYNAMAGQYE